MKHDSKTKKDELKTYALLQLKRTLKSGGQRRRLLSRGAQVILGNGQSDEPEIMVRRDHYQQVRMEVLAEELGKARQAGLNLSREQLLDCLAPQVETKTYRRLLLQTKSGARLETAFLQTHSRHPTQAETRLFNSDKRQVIASGESHDSWREDILEQVLGAIESRRENSSGRLQTIWAELVGPESAQQSSLEKVDSGIAWFRCLNSALTYHIQRRPDLPKKLSTKLGKPVRQIRVSY